MITSHGILAALLRCSLRDEPMNSAITNKIAEPAVKRVVGVSGFSELEILNFSTSDIAR